MLKNILKNQKIIDSTKKLKDLCKRFDTELVQRSKLKREKSDEISIPNYRELLQTKKFSNFSTCNCDKSSSHNKNHHHHHHHHHNSSSKS